MTIFQNNTLLQEFVQEAAERQALREVAHLLIKTPLSPRDLLVSSSSGGSASCLCGGWKYSALPNRAGDAATKTDFERHLRDLYESSSRDLSILLELLNDELSTS